MVGADRGLGGDCGTGDSWTSGAPRRPGKRLPVSRRQRSPFFLGRPMVAGHRERQSRGHSEADPQEAHHTLCSPRNEDMPLPKAAGREDDRKARGFPNQGRPEKDRPRKPRDRRRAAGAQLKYRPPMASVREWLFKRKFRTNAYVWRASSLAIGRLKEAATEISPWRNPIRSRRETA
jgi:hypothetical protein